MYQQLSFACLIWLALFSNDASARTASNAEQEVIQIQQLWAKGLYEVHVPQKKTFFEHLYQQSKALTQKYPKAAEVWTWHGIVASSLAQVKGGITALGLVKESKASLEKSIDINPSALQGSAYTSLGVLYDKVPGWPISFGNRKKAKEYLEISLSMNPDGIDSNYFYGTYLLEHGYKQEGVKYLTKALHAPDRPGRMLADSGRRQEIHSMLNKVN